MEIGFTKMNGCGNDFVVIDARPEALQGLKLTQAQVQRIAARDNPITKGCDQVLIIHPPKAGGKAFMELNNTVSSFTGSRNTAFMEIRNADGGEVEACGNGTRAVAAYLADNDNMQTGSIETLEGKLKYDTSLKMAGDTPIKETKMKTFVRIFMPPPKFAWQEIPLNKAINESTQELRALLKLEHIFFVNLGNPHAVFFVGGNLTSYAEEYGEALEKHPLFPARANINFARIESDISKWVPDKHQINFSVPVKNVIELSTWERGVGLTKSCGTGACASAVAYHHLYSKKSETVTGVSMAGGILKIIYAPTLPLLAMEGEAEFEFEGKVVI